MCQRSALSWRIFLPARVERRDSPLNQTTAIKARRLQRSDHPRLSAIKPALKIVITRFGADVHSFWKADKDLPVGIVPR